VIDPGGIPTIPGDMDALAGHAAALRGVGSDFATTGQRINTTWQGLGGVYRAPEIGQLLAATAPVQMISASVSADIGTVAGALSGYAAEVRQIQSQLASLRSQAGEFVASVAGHDDWTSDGGKVDRNNQLISAVDAQLAAFFDAQRRCANTINALYGGPRYRAEGGDGQLRDGEYGYTAEALGAAAGQHGALPWGTTEERDRGLPGDIVAFFGGVKDGAVGFVTGLGALIGRDPATGKWSWDTAGTAWKGVGTLILAVGVYAIPGGMRFDQTIGVPGLGRGALGETLTNAGKAIIAYDEWGKDPARAAGMATFNIVSAVVGTKGASAGPRAIGTAARDSRLATVSSAGTVMVRSGEAIGKLPTVSDLAKSAVQRIPGLHLPNLADTTHIHIPHHTDIPTPHTHGDLATSHPHLDLAEAIPHPGSVGDALSHTPRLPPHTPTNSPHLAVPGHHTEIPAPHSDVPGRHTDVPSQRAPANVSAHANAPAEGRTSGPLSGVHPNPAEPAPTHAAHDAPSEHGHSETPGHHDQHTADHQELGLGLPPEPLHADPHTPEPLHREEPLPTRDLRDRYAGENNPTNPNRAFYPDVVEYMSPQQLEAHRLFVMDGKLHWTADGALFDTRAAATHWSGHGRAMFVMDKHGNLYASLEQAVGRLHHSSFLRGKAVAGAGEIVVEDGIPTVVSRRSGHYEPLPEHQQQVREMLDEQGIDVSGITFENGF
jgi:hypothetical protein